MTVNALDTYRPRVGEIDDEQVCSDLVDACHVLAAYGHNDYVWGHVAARAAGGRGVWMKPAGLGMHEVTVGDIILVDWNGEVIEGSRRRHAEYPIHTQLMLARDDVNATVHSHAGRCTIFSSLRKSLRPLCPEATYFAPHGVAHFDETSDLITTTELGDALAHALGDSSAAFMAGHGIVTAGPQVRDATMAALLLESACRKQLATEAAGGPVPIVSPEEALATRAAAYSPELIHKGWSVMVRTVAMPRRSA